jgi:hypothetical protein
VAPPGLQAGWVPLSFPWAWQVARQPEGSPPETLRTFRKSGWSYRFHCRIVRSARSLLESSTL